MSDNNVGPIIPPRQITMEDVQRMIGAMTLELEMLRRENAILRQHLDKEAVAKE